MDMRRRPNLYMYFKEVRSERRITAEPTDTTSIIFMRQNFADVEEAINRRTVDPSIEDKEESLKAGMKRAYFYQLKRMEKIVIGPHLVAGNDGKADAVHEFLQVY